MADISRDSRPDQFLQALQQCDLELAAWSNRSPDNALLMARNPAAALRAAHLQMSREAMIEFVNVLNSLAEKLELSLREPAGSLRT